METGFLFTWIKKNSSSTDKKRATNKCENELSNPKMGLYLKKIDRCSCVSIELNCCEFGNCSRFIVAEETDTLTHTHTFSRRVPSVWQQLELYKFGSDSLFMWLFLLFFFCVGAKNLFSDILFLQRKTLLKQKPTEHYFE